MLPRCVQLPIWMCEMWDERACSPWTTTSTVTPPPGWTEREIVPEAPVLIPLSLKLNPLGVGDGVGLGLATRLGDGGDPVPPELPHAEAIAATAAIANHLFKAVGSPQVCSRRYPSRLLEAPRPLTRLKALGAAPPWSPGATPHDVTEAEKDQHWTSGAQRCDQVVDRRDEVVGCIAQCRCEAPAVRGRTRNRSTGL